MKTKPTKSPCEILAEMNSNPAHVIGKIAYIFTLIMIILSLGGI